MPRVDGGVTITTTTPLDPRAHTYLHAVGEYSLGVSLVRLSLSSLTQYYYYSITHTLSLSLTSIMLISISTTHSNPHAYTR